MLKSIRITPSYVLTLSIVLISSLSILPGSGQNFYDIKTIQKIEITFSQNNWDYQLDTSKAGAEGYIMAKSVAVNGVVFDSVGIKYKGNSTYNANQKKNPFHIELNTYKEQDYQGYTDIKLSNSAKDPTFIREVLSYEILRNYMDAPLANYANVYINGSLIGLYPNVESISKKFVNNHFYSNNNAFIKCNPIAGAGQGTMAKPNLVYLGKDSSAYDAAYELKSDDGWSALIALCDTLANNINGIENILDVDRVLWMLAFDNVFVNLDSYIGVFSQNYYLYQDDNGLFNPVVWDLNESLGTFSQTGTINLQNTIAKQQMTHLLHLNDAAWPLIQKLLAIPRYKHMYIAHMKTMISEFFASGTYFTRANELQTIINAAVQADPNKFFSYAQFQSNLTSDISGGMGGTPGIKNLMDGRSTYLLALTDFTATAPSISNVSASNNAPAINSTLYINATVTNAKEVFIGYRFSKESPFTKVKMFDDGVHNDGTAGDQVFGIDITMKTAFAEYYFYADNSNAGIFSPVRAEHEFYNLYAVQSTIQKGELVINELMADNGATIADAHGDYDDWIELYNTTSNTISLDNLYLSDSYTSTQKWKFPDGTTIGPKSYLIVWADDDEDQEGIHATFKLSATGEQAILSYDDSYVVDSISFGAQTKDISYLRCPNGSGTFKLYTPSFGAENCLTTALGEVNLNNQAEALKAIVFPNPANDYIDIQFLGPNSKPLTVELFDVSGRMVQKSRIAAKATTARLETTLVHSGTYLLKISSEHAVTSKIVMIAK